MFNEFGLLHITLFRQVYFRRADLGEISFTTCSFCLSGNCWKVRDSVVRKEVGSHPDRFGAMVKSYLQSGGQVGWHTLV